MKKLLPRWFAQPFFILHSSFFTLHLTTFLIFFGTDGHGFFKDTAFFIRHGKHGLTRIFLVRVITRCRVLPRVRPPTAKPPLELSVLHEVRPYIGGLYTGCAKIIFFNILIF